MDMSLDEIINSRRDKGYVLRGRGNIRKTGTNRERLNDRSNLRGTSRPGRISRPGIDRRGNNRSRPINHGFNRPRSNRSGEISVRDQQRINDARMKIIQNNRQKVADARDKLAEIAKKSDARLKLLKMKETNIKISARSSPVRSTQIRNNVLKTSISNIEPNSRRALSSRDRFGRGRDGRGRARGRLEQGLRRDPERLDRVRERSPRGVELKRLINNDLAPRNRNQGLRFNFRGRGRGVGRPMLKRSIDNDSMDSNPIVWRESKKERGFRSGVQGRSAQNVFDRNRFKRSFIDSSNSDESQELRGNDAVLMRTFSNQHNRNEMDNFNMKMTRPSQIKVVMHNDPPIFMQKQQHQIMEVDEEYDHYFKQPARPLTIARPARSFTDHFPNQGDEHIVQRGGPPGARMSQEMLARLDTPAPVPRSMGILSSQGPQPASMNADIGHRIVVSNLQPSVTHEDIKELFEDIGPLLASRVVRPGTAEVIYNLQKDAKKAVEAYHNRQLDGQPMKCMLVNPRALPLSTGSIGLRSPVIQAKIPSSSKSSVMPDLMAIHKALFSK